MTCLSSCNTVRSCPTITVVLNSFDTSPVENTSRIHETDPKGPSFRLQPLQMKPGYQVSDKIIGPLSVIAIECSK